MIHANHEDRVRRAALNQLRALLQGDGSRGAGGGDSLHRTARTVLGGEIGSEQLRLEMAARLLGARPSVREAFERFDVRLGGGQDQTDTPGREFQITRSLTRLRERIGGEGMRGIVFARDG